MVAGLAGYFVGNLGLGYPWEKLKLPTDVPNSPLNILIQASNGASDYGNKIGEPIIQGVTRSYGDILTFRRVEPIEKLIQIHFIKVLLKK